MHPISKSVIKKDHQEKINGSATYIADFPQAGMLHVCPVRSPHAHANILSLKFPTLPEGYFSVDYHDVKGENIVHIVEDDSPVFAEREVFYIGEIVALIVGPCADEARQLAEATVVEYEVLPAILDIDDSQTVFFDYRYQKGDVAAAFAAADKVYDEHFETGYQEQAYLETNGVIAHFDGDTLTVHGSMQCPYYVKDALVKATGLGKDNVVVAQDYTGGGFGGKEDYPSNLAAQASMAAMKVPGKDIRFVLDRQDDMEFSSKRHPSRCHYRAAVKDGRVTALEATIRFNSGAYTTLSPVVLQRGVIAAPGVYDIHNLSVQGLALRTNTVPTGAYRGFGAPQSFFSIELLMDHIAADLGLDALEFKKAHLVKKGDSTSTSGIYHFEVPLPEMIAKAQKMSDYERKHALYAAAQDERYSRGIGMALWYHGAGFTGSGERDFIKAEVGIKKYADGRVEVLAANSDIGQGIKTTFAKIVAHELGMDTAEIIVNNPDTSKVFNSGPTVASRSLMVVGELLRRAAARLKAEWSEGTEQIITENYKEPNYMVPFNLAKFDGDAYPTYAWGVGVVELEFDRLTGNNHIIGSWNVFDVGTPIDERIVIGGLEGGVLQGLGYSSMEQMAYDGTGRIRNNSFSDYIIPTAVDTDTLEVALHVVEFPEGPYGAKGAGELPLVGIAPAFIAAAEQACGAQMYSIPLSSEQALKHLQSGGSPKGKVQQQAEGVV